MTSGLRWWHNVCREVRESGAATGRQLRTAEGNGGTATLESFWLTFDPEAPSAKDDGTLQELIVEAVQSQDDLYCATIAGVHRPGLAEKQYQFLRRQWLAAYKKARTANS